MKDQSGREVKVFVVSGKADPPPGPTSSFVTVHLTLVLRTGDETRKVEVSHNVYLKDRHVSDPENRNEKQFEEKWKDMESSAMKLAEGDKSVGRFFLTEAIAAYGAKEKLRPDQIKEAMAGAFLVDRVNEL